MQQNGGEEHISKRNYEITVVQRFIFPDKNYKDGTLGFVACFSKVYLWDWGLANSFWDQISIRQTNCQAQINSVEKRVRREKESWWINNTSWSRNSRRWEEFKRGHKNPWPGKSDKNNKKKSNERMMNNSVKRPCQSNEKKIRMLLHKRRRRIENLYCSGKEGNFAEILEQSMGVGTE
jgi:hypothetical protein